MLAALFNIGPAEMLFLGIIAATLLIPVVLLAVIVYLLVNWLSREKRGDLDRPSE